MEELDDAARAKAMRRAIRTGWALWFRSLPATIRNILPIAAVASLAFCASGLSAGMHGGISDKPSAWALWVLALALPYGIALVGAIQAEIYTARITGNPYLWTARRLVPWVAAWWLYIVISYVGLFLLVIPGLILGVRLFWADEYALTHSCSPLKALKESWSLTKGHGWRIYGLQFLLGFVEWIVLMPAFVVGAVVFAFVGSSGFQHLFIVQFMEVTALILLLFVAYGSLHAPQIVYFYGLVASRQLAARKGTEQAQDSDGAVSSPA